MISIYRGSDYFEAQLLRDLIEQDGLQVFLQGAALQGVSLHCCVEKSPAVFLIRRAALVTPVGLRRAFKLDVCKTVIAKPVSARTRTFELTRSLTDRGRPDKATEIPIRSRRAAL